MLAAALAPEPRRPWVLGRSPGSRCWCGRIWRRRARRGRWLLASPWTRRGGRLRADAAAYAARSAFALASSPFVALLCAERDAVRPSRCSPGYGSAADLFSAATRARPTCAVRRALCETQLAFPLLGLAALVARAGAARACGLARRWPCSVTIAVVYLLYRPVSRVVVPAVPSCRRWSPLTVLALATVVDGSVDGCERRASRSWLRCSSCGHRAGSVSSTARERQAFDLQRTRAPLSHDRATWSAIGCRPTRCSSPCGRAARCGITPIASRVLWDSLRPGVARSRPSRGSSARGFEPYLARRAMGGAAVPRAIRGPLRRSAQLDWPPRFEIDRQVRIYPSGRSRVATWPARTVPTEFVIRRADTRRCGAPR